MSSDSQTLSQRLGDGWMPVSEAIGYARQLGAALQAIHEQSQVHGALTPDHVVLTASGLQLLPPEPADAVTPSTAPEQVQGHPPDARADIFAFGAILYEMLSGVPPFQGDTSEELAGAILSQMPAPIGQPRFDRLVTTCMFKNPAARWQNMQQVMRELEPSLSLRIGGRTATRPSGTRSKARSLRRKARLARRQTKTPAAGLSPKQAAALKAISEELIALRTQVAEAGERAAGAEQTAEEARIHVNCLEAAAGKMRDLQQDVEAQALTVESTAAALKKTDALVEMVVDTLETLQTRFLDAFASMPHQSRQPQFRQAG